MEYTRSKDTKLWAVPFLEQEVKEKQLNIVGCFYDRGLIQIVLFSIEQVKLAQFNKVIKDIQRAMVKLNLDE